jgi:hypothetical protein
VILSVPSYVIPGTYAENLRFLVAVSEVRAVELLFYLYDGPTAELLRREAAEIASHRGRFSFSVHLPDDLQPEHEEILALTRPFADRYVLHPPASPPQAFLRTVERWRGRYGEIFLLENLVGRGFAALARRWPGMPVCCDTGHLLLGGEEIGRFLDEYGGRIGEIHLHGVRDGRDHRGFGPGEDWFQRLVPFLRGFQGVLNLEVFSIGEVRAILDALRARGLLAGPLRGSAGG